MAITEDLNRSVMEGVGTIMVCVSVMPTAMRDVMVNLQTMDVTAMGNKVYVLVIHVCITYVPFSSFLPPSLSPSLPPSSPSLPLPPSLLSLPPSLLSLPPLPPSLPPAGSDYTPLNGPLTIPAGQTMACDTITITDDAIVEGGESFTVTLTAPADDVTVTEGMGVLTVTIQADTDSECM